MDDSTTYSSSGSDEDEDVTTPVGLDYTGATASADGGEAGTISVSVTTGGVPQGYRQVYKIDNVAVTANGPAPGTGQTVYISMKPG
ncbi:MAG TPA: hypothetical protein VGD01_12525 [Candidatus Elarobacter sp.]|jgi:hypothetical protein